MSNLKISIDGKACVIASPKQSVAALLGETGLTVEDASLVTPDGITHDDPEEMVHVSEGDHFETRRATDDQTIHYQVNGEDQTTIGNRLTVGAIFKHAGRSASINANELPSYYLENISTEQRYDDLDAEVVVYEGDRFIAVHRGATPVA